jgi:hypothetical protein
MHAVFGTCLLGGFVATVLLAALGALGADHAIAGHLTLNDVWAAALGAALVRAAMAAFVRAGMPPLHGAAVGAVGTLSAPLRVAASDEVLSRLAGCGAAGTPL